MTTEKQLTQFFKKSDIGWKKSNVSPDDRFAKAVPTLNVRSIQKRLDEVVGMANWQVSYQEVITGNKMLAVRCILKIVINDNWVSKEDVGYNSAGKNEEAAVTAAYATAFRRAASNFGIGRYLYDFKLVSQELAEDGSFKETPSLPNEFLLEEEQIQVDTSAKPAPAPAPVERGPFEGVVGQSQAAPEEAPSRKEFTDKVADQAAAKTDTSEPAVSAEEVKVGKLPKPENLAPEEATLVADLETKIKKVPLNLIEAYINGPQGTKKLSEASRKYLLNFIEVEKSTKKS